MLAIGHHLSPEVLLSRTWKWLRLRSASFWETCDPRATVDDAPGCYSAVLACMAGCVLVPDLAPYCVPRSPGLLFVSASVDAFFRLAVSKRSPSLIVKSPTIFPGLKR